LLLVATLGTPIVNADHDRGDRQRWATTNSSVEEAIQVQHCIRLLVRLLVIKYLYKFNST
jgi:hypothetical protein